MSTFTVSLKISLYHYKRNIKKYIISIIVSISTYTNSLNSTLSASWPRMAKSITAMLFFHRG